MTYNSFHTASLYTTIKLVTGKPDEDVEAHLSRTNDGMDTHAFQEGVKVLYSCQTLVGEARLWYKSLRSINIDRNRL